MPLPYFSMKCNFYFFLTWDGSYVFIAFYVSNQTPNIRQAWSLSNTAWDENLLHSHLGLTCKPCKYVWQWNWLRWKRKKVVAALKAENWNLWNALLLHRILRDYCIFVESTKKYTSSETNSEDLHLKLSFWFLKDTFEDL